MPALCGFVLEIREDSEVIQMLGIFPPFHALGPFLVIFPERARKGRLFFPMGESGRARKIKLSPANGPYFAVEIGQKT